MEDHSQIQSLENSHLVKLFKKAVYISKASRIQRIRKIPSKILFLKVLQLIAKFFNKSIRITTKTFFDENMLIIIPEDISLKIYRYGFFEESLTRMILGYLKPGMIFFDIGAHFGYFTLLSSIIVGKEGQVHSFEPTPSTFKTLKTNVSNKKNVILNNCAVFSKHTKIFINDYGIKYSASNSIYNARLPQDILRKLKERKYEIEAISIDDYVEDKVIIPNFIKIDAESSEYEILLGMEKTINKFHPIISIEVGDVGVRNIPKSRELISYLLNKGYYAYEFKDDKISRHKLKNEYQYDNILFLPRQ